MITILTSPEAMQRHADDVHAAGRSIGFVPTMGALHEGHLSLIRTAAQQCDDVVVSIFVNPTQFAPHEDLARYPRPFARDIALAEAAGARVVFHPDADAMYANDAAITIDPGPLATVFEGVVRPDHFRGVATIVAKLFHIVKPDIAFFGQKDAQQAAILTRMVRDLNFDLRLEIAPIVREEDGVAMSSRNVYLSGPERIAARAISRSLFAAHERFLAGERDAAVLKEIVENGITRDGALTLDYAAVVDADTFTPVEHIGPDTRAYAIAAARAGATRLIDNILLAYTEAVA